MGPVLGSRVRRCHVICFLTSGTLGGATSFVLQSPKLPHATTAGPTTGRSAAAASSRSTSKSASATAAADDLPAKWGQRSFWSDLTFSWASPALALGQRRTLEAKDVDGIPVGEPAQVLCEDFEDNLKLAVQTQTHLSQFISPSSSTPTAGSAGTREDEAGTTSARGSNTAKKLDDATMGKAVVAALLARHWKAFAGTGALRLTNTLLQVWPPLLLASLLRLLESKAGLGAGASTGVVAATLSMAQINAMHWQALLMGGGLATCLTLKALCESQYFFHGQNLGTKVKVALRGAIYAKALRLGPGARQRTTLGAMNNLMQLDANKVGDFAAAAHTLWDGVLQIVLCTFLLGKLLGPSVAVCVVLLGLLLPLNALAFKTLSRIRQETLKHTDARVKLAAEVLQGARLVKTQAMEPAFLRRLSAVRGAEQAAVRRGAVVSSSLSAALGAAPTVVFAVTLLVYASLGNALAPSTVFAALTLFNQLRFPLLFLPVVLTQLVDAKVALFRISAFLANEEVVPYVHTGGTGGLGAAIADDETSKKEGEKHAAVASSKTAGLSSSSSSSSSSSLEADLLPRGYVRLGPGAFYWSDPNSSSSSFSSTAAKTSKSGSVTKEGTVAAAAAAATVATGGATAVAPPPPSPALLVEQPLVFHPGELVCVVGPVGVGKSALLQALVGAMHAATAPTNTTQRSSQLPSPAAEDAAADAARAAASTKAEGDERKAASTSTDPVTAAARFFTSYWPSPSSSSPASGRRANHAPAQPPAAAAVVGSVAYCAQSAWLPSTTVQRAIVFGRHATTGREPSDDVYADGSAEKDTDGSADGSAKADASSSSWYTQVLEACQLMTDLDSLPGGDAAEVGEGGVTLSGGQRQRVAMARAVFGQPDVALFDDTLGALDPEVAQKFFRSVLSRKSGLLQNSTVVFATNQLQWLPKADKVIVLGHANAPDEDVSGGEAGSGDAGGVGLSNGSGGRRSGAIILHVGTYQELESRGHDFALLSSSAQSSAARAPTCTDERSAEGTPNNESSDSISDSASGRGVSTKTAPEDAPVESEAVAASVNANESAPYSTSTAGTASPSTGVEAPFTSSSPSTANKKAKGLVLVSEEERAVGAVGKSVYTSFLGAVQSRQLMVAFCACAVLSQAAGVGQQLWLALWSADPLYTRHTLPAWVSGLLGFAALSSTMAFARAFATVSISLRAGAAIHERLVATVLAAPLRFFEETPSGRLLQRFSTDVETVDNSVASGIGQCVSNLLSIGGSLFTLISASPAFAPFVPLLSVIYLKVMAAYRPGFRELKRAEALLRTPVFSAFGETVAGLPTLRAYGAHTLKRSTRRMHRALDKSAKGLTAQKTAERWLAVRLESLGNAVVLLAVGLAIRGAFTTLLPSNTVPATFAALDRMNTVLQSTTPPQLAAILAILHAKASVLVAPLMHGVFAASSAASTSVSASAATAATAVGTVVPAPVTSTLASAAASLASALGLSASTGAAAGAAGAMAVDSQTQLLRAGLAGLAVSNAMAVTSMLQWAVRCFVTLESDMNSMERLLQTLQTTPTEGNKAAGAGAATTAAAATCGDGASANEGGADSPQRPQHRPPIDWKSPLPGAYDATGAPAFIAAAGSAPTVAAVAVEGAAASMQVEVEAPFLKQQHPLEVVQDEAFPNAVGIAAADPARVDPDQDYFAVVEGVAAAASFAAISAAWPTDGKIEFRDVTLRYRPEAPKALDHFSFVALPGERIGVVGRSGSGKSTLMAALLRLAEIDARDSGSDNSEISSDIGSSSSSSIARASSHLEGMSSLSPSSSSSSSSAITVDGFDIRNVPLNVLRSKIGILPQDPTLFSGTIRSNLDPAGDIAADANGEQLLWSALEKCSLAGAVAGMGTGNERGLDAPVAEFGENLSGGQRQLLCLARTLLRKPKILLLDEATAAVDYATDALIQATIRKEFAGCTSLVVAHRLGTVLDCDRVLVLEAGKVVEEGPPQELLRKPNSRFARMASQEGLGNDASS